MFLCLFVCLVCSEALGNRKTIDECCYLSAANRAISQNIDKSSEDVSSQEISMDVKYEMSYLNRLCGDSFRLPLIMTITLVYTLMSYYVMVAKKSLNYLTDLKSVELEREQKAFLVSSSIACVI